MIETTHSGIMDKIIDGLLQSGATGAILLLVLYINYKIGLELISVIKTNTAALTSVTDSMKVSTDTIEKNSEVLKSLKIK